MNLRLLYGAYAWSSVATPRRVSATLELDLKPKGVMLGIRLDVRVNGDLTRIDPIWHLGEERNMTSKCKSSKRPELRKEVSANTEAQMPRSRKGSKECEKHVNLGGGGV